MSKPVGMSWVSVGRRCRSRSWLQDGLATLAALLLLVAQVSATPPAAETGTHENPADPQHSASGSPADVAARLRRLEQLGTVVLEQNQRLADQNRQLMEANRELERRLQDVNRRHDELAKRLDLVMTPLPPAGGSLEPRNPALEGAGIPAVAPIPTSDVLPSAIPPDDHPWVESPFHVGGYDREKGQFVLVQPRDSNRTPFALNFDLVTQLRYTGFSRSYPTWTDSAGVVLPVRNYNTIEVNRNWFQFSGYALDPRLQFMAVLFNSSTNGSTQFLGWLDYEFSTAFKLSGGYFKVPGSREWSDSFRYTLGADRTMATTFFRPSMSPGFWVSGKPLADFHYISMIANSFNGQNLADNRIGNNMAFATSLWWEPLGEFGPGYSDVEEHERAAVRIGSSLTLSRETLANPNTVATNPESTVFRLSDGTPLASAGALGPGSHIQTTSVQLWAVDAAVKYRGFSLSGEYYFRWLSDFLHTGNPPTVSSLFDNGAYVQGSYFVVPRKLEGYARYSFVTGRFGGGDEWSGGLNWYVRGIRRWRATFDVTRINHSPAQNVLTGYRAGESGTLFQLQMLTDF